MNSADLIRKMVISLALDTAYPLMELIDEGLVPALILVGCSIIVIIAVKVFKRVVK